MWIISFSISSLNGYLLVHTAMEKRVWTLIWVDVSDKVIRIEALPHCRVTTPRECGPQTILPASCNNLESHKEVGPDLLIVIKPAGDSCPPGYVRPRNTCMSRLEGQLTGSHYQRSWRRLTANLRKRYIWYTYRDTRPVAIRITLNGSPGRPASLDFKGSPGPQTLTAH